MPGPEQPVRQDAARVRHVAAALILAAPAVLAFRTGGYIDGPRLVAGAAAWALVLAAAVAAGRPLPRGRWPRLAVAGLALLTAWTGLSLLWAPLSDRATDDLQRALLYLGALIAAAAWLRHRPAARAAEPALAAGTLAAAVYGLGGRLLPDLVEQDISRRALGRLEQPLTYWNALGAFTAVGVLLCARLAGDRERRTATRAAALAAAVPLGAALHLTYSRGSLAALAVGAIVLAAVARDRAELAGLGAVLVAAVAGALAVAAFPAVADGEVDPGGQGVGALAVLLLAMAAAGALGHAMARSARLPGEAAPAAAGRRGRVIAVGAVAAVALAGLAVTIASIERVQVSDEAGATVGRLQSVDSQRYDYWQVAADAFASEPLHGVGSGGFRAEWRREQPPGSAPASDAHSLYVETAAELGLAGLAALALLVAAVAVCAVRALRRDRALAAGPVAALALLGFHAGVDWDWEMPALMLVAVVLAGLLMAASDDRAETPAMLAP